MQQDNDGKRPEQFKHNVRKLSLCGHSYVLTLPRTWVKANVNDRFPYVSVTVVAPGILEVRAYANAPQLVANPECPPQPD